MVVEVVVVVVVGVVVVVVVEAVVSDENSHDQAQVQDGRVECWGGDVAVRDGVRVVFVRAELVIVCCVCGASDRCAVSQPCGGLVADERFRDSTDDSIEVTTTGADSGASCAAIAVSSALPCDAHDVCCSFDAQTTSSRAQMS